MSQERKTMDREVVSQDWDFELSAEKDEVFSRKQNRRFLESRQSRVSACPLRIVFNILTS